MVEAIACGAVVLDVNETLFPLTPVRDRMVRAGLAPDRLEPWFRAVLVDGIAASASGRFATFADLARHHLEVELLQVGVAVTDATIDQVLAGFGEVVPHADVLPALETLDGAGVEVALLTNGSATIAERFLDRAGLRALVDHVWDVGASGRWKPHAAPYRWAAEQLGQVPADVAMVAVHPWDVQGAMAAGLRGVWVDRPGRGRYPPGFTPPDHTVHALTELADRIAG